MYTFALYCCSFTIISINADAIWSKSKWATFTGHAITCCTYASFTEPFAIFFLKIYFYFLINLIVNKYYFCTLKTQTYIFLENNRKVTFFKVQLKRGFYSYNYFHLYCYHIYHIYHLFYFLLYYNRSCNVFKAILL